MALVIPDIISLMTLSRQQEAFIHEYVVDFNGGQAAIRAGYGAPGARVRACELLKREEVQGAIRERQALQAAACELTATEVTQRLMHEAVNAREGSARVSALELLGRHIGYFEGDAPEVGVAILPALRELTADELRGIIDAPIVPTG